MRQTSPLRDALASIVRALSPVDLLAYYDCEVLSQHTDDGTLDLKPTDGRLGTGLSRVPLALDVGIDSVKITPGGTVMVGFKNGDRQKPYARWIAGSVLEVVLSAQTKITIKAPQIEIGKTATQITLGKGLKPVASQGDLVQTVPATGKGTIDTTTNTLVLV